MMVSGDIKNDDLSRNRVCSFKKRVALFCVVCNVDPQQMFYIEEGEPVFNRFCYNVSVKNIFEAVEREDVIQ